MHHRHANRYTLTHLPATRQPARCRASPSARMDAHCGVRAHLAKFSLRGHLTGMISTKPAHRKGFSAPSEAGRFTSVLHGNLATCSAGLQHQPQQAAASSHADMRDAITPP